MVGLIMVKYGTIQPCEHDKEQTIKCILINFSHIAHDEDEAYCFCVACKA